VLTGFEFRGIAGPLKLAPGTHDVNVRLAASPACSGAVAIAAPGLVLAPGANVSIVAHLAEASTATPTASVFPNDTSRTHGKARVVARHGANFGPVDVLVNGAVAFPGLANGKQAMADLKRGTYEIAIAPAATSTEVYANTLKLKPGRAYNAYAVGTPAGGTFEVLLQVTRLGRRCDLSRGEAHD
jgi:NAD(P)-dependent dehydrogenase (short-subunit alcohol dehydrogenase family)